MMAGREHYPSPDLSWASAGAPPYGQPHPIQAPRTFQASRDWSWVQPPPPAPAPGWPYSTFSSAGAGYPQLYSGLDRPAYQHERRSYGQNQWRKKNKQKEAEFSHFCDTCDRAFKDQSKYQEHMGQHVKCSVEDCRFTAHEKIVKIHWMNNHAPGAKRIKLDTPEEITKWREERRRNYPTLNNVEKKVKLMEVKERRGDVLETAQFGRFKRREGGGRHRGRGFQNHRGCRGNRNQGLEQKEEPQSITQASQDGDPLGALVHSDPDSEKEESRKETCVSLSVAPKCMTSALGSLISSYGDGITESEEEAGQDPDASPVLKAAVALEENKVLLVPSSNSVQNLSQRSHLNSGVPPPAHHRNRPSGRTVGPGRQNPRSRCGTLLEMLLAPDIRHERNVVLQCVRFIIYNGFFGLKPSDPTSRSISGGPHSSEAETCVVRPTCSDVVSGRLVCQSREGNGSNVYAECNKMDTTVVLKQKEVLRCATVSGASSDAQAKIQQLEANLIKTHDSSQLRVSPLTLTQNLKSDDIPAVPQDMSSGETFQTQQSSTFSHESPGVLAEPDLLPKHEMHVSLPGIHKETCAGLMMGSTDLSSERTGQKAPVFQDLPHQRANYYDDIIWEDSGWFSNTV